MLDNDRHRANIRKAFVEYLESDSFSGHVYPGYFYDFCRSRSVFKNTNNTLCNRVQLSLHYLAMRTKRAIENALSHVSVMTEHQIVHLTDLLSSFSNEKKLIEYFEKSNLSKPFYDPKRKRKSEEMFELPALNVPKMFADIIFEMQSS